MLSPLHVVQAARADIASVRGNAAVKLERSRYKHVGASAEMAGRSKKTTFLPRHIRYCALPSQVIQKAISDPLPGRDHALPKTTQAIYNNTGLLHSALKLALEQEQAELVAVSQ